MNIKSRITITAAILFLANAAYACDYPRRANLPNGSTASKDEMLAGQSSVKAYMASMEEYLACIDTEEKASVAALVDPSDDDLAQREAAIAKKHNAAVEEMELVAAQFNSEVQAYKAQGN